MKKIYTLLTCSILGMGSWAQLIMPGDLKTAELAWGTGFINSYEIEASGYVIYQTTVSRDVQQKITGLEGSINALFGDEEYRVTSSVTGLVTTYIGETKEPSNGMPNFTPTDKHIVYSNGSLDTAIYTESYSTSSSAWVPDWKFVVTYNGNDQAVSWKRYFYDANNSVYDLVADNIIKYNGTKVDSIKVFDYTSGSADQISYQKYYYTGNVMDSSLEYNKVSGAYVLDRKNVFVQDGNFKTTSMNEYQWDASANAYTGGSSVWYFNRLSTPSAIDEVQKYGFQIFPNPSSGIIKIASLESIEELTVYALDGAQLIRRTVVNGENIDLSHLAKGCYLVKVGNNAQRLILE